MSVWHNLAHVDRHIFRAQNYAVSIGQHMHVVLHREVSGALLKQSLLLLKQRVYDVHTRWNCCARKHHQL